MLRRILTLVLAFVLTLLSPVLSVGAGERLLLVTNEYAPYVMLRGNRPGLLAELVKAAFADQGVAVSIQFLPWRRCAMLVEQGEVFAAFPYTKTDKREGYAWFSAPFWICHNVFFYLKERMPGFDFTSLEGLIRYTIAGTSGHYYERAFKEAGLRVDYAPGEASGVRKLQNLRCDLFAEDRLVGWTLISRIFPGQKDRFGCTPTAWSVNMQHLMVSKKWGCTR